MSDDVDDGDDGDDVGEEKKKYIGKDISMFIFTGN